MSKLQQYLEMLKKPDLYKPIFQINKKAHERVEHGFCADCGDPIKEEDFRDEQSKKEYSISGLCQRCQDDIFGK
jgi:RNA polymerase-binding transcription factor DksA